MKSLIKLIFLVLLCALLAYGLSYIETGHVIILLLGYRVDLSLIALLLLIAVLYFVLYVSYGFLNFVSFIPTQLGKWFDSRKERKQQDRLINAMLNYIANEPERAYKYALLATKGSSKKLAKEEFLALILAVKAGEQNDNSELLKRLELYHTKNYLRFKNKIFKSQL